MESKNPPEAHIGGPGSPVDNILAECTTHVQIGLGNKTLSAGAKAQLDGYYGPKIQNRLNNGGVWNNEKAKPLVVAEHLGQICAILSTGNTISVAVAMAAANAVRSDETCPAGMGAGQWCF